MDAAEKARDVLAHKRKEDNNTKVVMKVTDLAHAKSEEVLRFCVNELTKGSTWNVLRRKLGLGPAGVDNRWRVLKEILCSAHLPVSDDEALKANYEASTYMLTRIEHFIEKVETRVEALEGTEEESKVLKVHLDAIKLQWEAYNKRFEFYAKLKELKMVDQKSQGTSIIYQNNYFIPRPGQNVEWKDGRPVLNVEAPEILNVEKKDQITQRLAEVEKKLEGDGKRSSRK